MSSFGSTPFSPMVEISTFKQKIEESFKEAWSRISALQRETEPKMSLSLVIDSFYRGISLRYRYALDAVAEKEFLLCTEDEAYDAIIKLIMIYDTPGKSDSSFTSIFARLKTSIAAMNSCYHTLRAYHDYVPINSEPSNWFPTIKVSINTTLFDACCDIMSEFCLMPKDIFDSLSLWGLIEGGEEIYLTKNTTILPIGIAEGVFTKISGKMVSTDYLVIECVGKGQITLRRSLLKHLGAVIDVGEGILHFTPPVSNHIFSKKKKKVRKEGTRGAILYLKILDSSCFLCLT